MGLNVFCMLFAIAANVLVLVIFILRRALFKDKIIVFIAVGVSVISLDIALLMRDTTRVYVLTFALYFLLISMVINILINRHNSS